MITILFQDNENFSQYYYDEAIGDIQLHRVECVCGKKGCLIRHGHYRRCVKFMSVLIHLSVQRVRCKECGATHALLPSVIVPYSQIPLHDQQEILDCVVRGRHPEAVMERNILIDESNVKYIVRQFKRQWEQRLASGGLSLMDCLTVPCLRSYSRQFMQAHQTQNKLYVLPTRHDLKPRPESYIIH